MRVRIWGNPRTTSNLNCLFYMHNRKWMNLSKMAGLNINRGQSSSHKKHYLSLRFVLFFPFRCCFTGSLQFTSSTVKQTKLFHSNFRDLFHFFTRKTLRENFSRWMSAKGRYTLQAPIKGGNFGAKLTHLCGFWLDITFSSHVKKHRSRFWLNISFFSRVKTIVRSSDCLELICVCKFTTQLFGEYLSVCK